MLTRTNQWKQKESENDEDASRLSSAQGQLWQPNKNAATFHMAETTKLLGEMK